MAPKQPRRLVHGSGCIHGDRAASRSRVPISCAVFVALSVVAASIAMRRVNVRFYLSPGSLTQDDWSRVAAAEIGNARSVRRLARLDGILAATFFHSRGRRSDDLDVLLDVADDEDVRLGLVELASAIATAQSSDNSRMRDRSLALRQLRALEALRSKAEAASDAVKIEQMQNRFRWAEKGPYFSPPPPPPPSH